MKRVMAPVAVCLLLAARPTSAQSWRLRFDGAAQRVAIRSIVPDSIREAAVQIGPTGGPISPDGFAVNCFNDGFCHFYRPGSMHRGLPAMASTDLTLWGLGVTGLRVRMHARLNTDLAGERPWAGATPRLQLTEGFAEYIRNGLTVQGGRLLDQGRLGNAGLGMLDGARFALRLERLPLEIALYGGWGMARGTVLPITSPAVNPLLDYSPGVRQIVAGGSIGVRLPRVDAMVEYRREIDPNTNYLVAERAGISAQLRPFNRISLTGGADYDVALGQLGTAEVTLAYSAPRLWAMVGARHYRPYFDLWTVWGAFSPVPYRGVNASLAVGALKTLQLRGHGEWFRYEPTEASTPLVNAKESGWRAGLEATVTPRPQWIVVGGAHTERLPGASSEGMDARVSWRPRDPLTLSLEGGALQRPLEFRFQDAALTWIGAAANYRMAERWQLGATIDRYWESRDRLDAAAFDWNQWRLGLRASVTLRSNADRWALPPARPAGTMP